MAVLKKLTLLFLERKRFQKDIPARPLPFQDFRQVPVFLWRNRIRLCALLPAIGILLSLSACGLSRKARGVADKIDLLAEITLDTGAFIDEIDAAYNALSDREKRQVGNLDVLYAAKEEYHAQRAEEEQRQKSEAEIEALHNTIQLLNMLRASELSDLDTAIEAVKCILLLKIAGTHLP